jgi:maleate cis-trans isomerase
VTDQLSLGFLYPGYSAEDDIPWLVERLFPSRVVTADLVHTSVGEDAHTVDAVYDLGRPERLRPGAAVLRDHGADVALWACTSGSFTYGLPGARDQAEAVANTFGGPASSTSLAFVAALQALELERVAIAATYPQPVANAFADFLTEAGFDVVACRASEIYTAHEAGKVGRSTVIGMIREGDDPGAQAVLAPDTALHTVRWLDELEQAVEKPVLTANQVSVWEALRLAGRPVTEPSYGSLFVR